MGFRLNLNKWTGLSVQSPLSTSSSSWPSSYSCRGRETAYLARVAAPSVVYGETESLTDLLRPSTYSSGLRILDSNYLLTKDIKTEFSKQSHDSIHKSTEEDDFTFSTSVEVAKASQFILLMKNLDSLEKMFADSDVTRLERDILTQLERLGALELFQIYLSRTLKSSILLDISHTPTELVEEPRTNDPVEDHVDKVIVQSKKKELRSLRRKRALEKHNDSSILEFQSQNSSRKRSIRQRNKRLKVARNEAEMSTGVKLVADLERIRARLEEETGQMASVSTWAEAAGVEKKVLLMNLRYGWHCRDELLRSTRSLVLFIARSYWGLGVGFEDLIQAGNLGVLQGAERFDQSRGYKFSTYVQYWIRKSMSMLVTRHARGVRIPLTLSKVINQVQKARKALSASYGKRPDDHEIAKFTGLSLAKIDSASKCLRVVGSLDQKIGECISAKYLEVIPDTSMPSPEEAVTRQHMVQDVYQLLDGLEPRERKVLVLRFGLGNHQCKSLEEIGRLFSVSKEWIRKIERSALTKLRNEKSLQNLSHYLHDVS